MDWRERGAAGVLVASVLVVLATVILPMIPAPQVDRLQGPIIPYGNSTYVISSFYIPTVQEGTPMTVRISGYEPGTIILSFFPTAENVVSATGPPLISFQRPVGDNVSETIDSPATQPYGIDVVSYNGTGYLLEVASSWSPYYVLRIYTYPAAFVVIVALISLYYFRQVAPRRKWEKEAMDSAMPRTNKAAPLLPREGSPPK